MSKRILILVTSTKTMGDTDKATGIWAEEFSVPYYQFIDAGYEVVVASPAGGAIQFDPASYQPGEQVDSATERLLSDALAKSVIETTLPLGDIDISDFDAVFLPGGHGTMWDLPGNEQVKTVVEQAYTDNKIVAAVCHGPAGLVSACTADGQSILAGRKVNSFTNEEEEEVGLIDVVPFALETRLRELGGDFVNGEKWQPFAVRDGNLITGQNPQSSSLVAQEVISALAI